MSDGDRVESEGTALPVQSDEERSRRTYVRWRPCRKRRDGFAGPER